MSSRVTRPESTHDSHREGRGQEGAGEWDCVVVVTVVVVVYGGGRGGSGIGGGGSSGSGSAQHAAWQAARCALTALLPSRSLPLTAILMPSLLRWLRVMERGEGGGGEGATGRVGSVAGMGGCNLRPHTTTHTHTHTHIHNANVFGT